MQTTNANPRSSLNRVRGMDRDADGRRPTGRTHRHRAGKAWNPASAPVFAEIAAPDRLAFRWSWGADFPYGGPGDTEAIVEFHPDGMGTRAVLRQRGFTDPALSEAHARGWKRCFDGMERLLAETEG